MPSSWATALEETEALLFQVSISISTRGSFIGDYRGTTPGAPKPLITPIFPDFFRFFPVFPWTSSHVPRIPGVLMHASAHLARPCLHRCLAQLAGAFLLPLSKRVA